MEQIMRNRLIIIGGGHVGLKAYSALKGHFDSIIVIEQKTDNISSQEEKRALLEFLCEKHDTSVYVATPDKSHFSWCVAIPQSVGTLLVEKPATATLVQLYIMEKHLKRQSVPWTMNLPWRAVLDNTSIRNTNFDITKGVEWKRDIGFLYKKKSDRIVEDIGPHVIDLIGMVLGRSKSGFDKIMDNDDSHFTGIYKNIPISIMYAEDSFDSLGFNLFGLKLPSVIPEEYFVEIYKKVLLQYDISNMPSYEEVLWCQKMIEQTREPVC